jgi:hypothetical protein
VTVAGDQWLVVCGMWYVWLARLNWAGPGGRSAKISLDPALVGGSEDLMILKP